MVTRPAARLAGARAVDGPASTNRPGAVGAGAAPPLDSRRTRCGAGYRRRRAAVRPARRASGARRHDDDRDPSGPRLVLTVGAPPAVVMTAATAEAGARSPLGAWHGAAWAARRDLRLAL